MDRYVVGENQLQGTMFPMSLDEMIDAENPVRAINAIIEKMGVLALGFKYSSPKETGRKAYNPVDMLKLYVYCYFNGIRSSRKIERECKRNIEVMWLIGKLAPDFKTIADFRKNNKEGIKKAFSQFSMLCDAVGLIGKEIVAIDGSKFKACNSQDRYYTKKKVESKIKYFEKKATQYIELLDENDKDDSKNPPPQFDATDLKEKLEHAEKRLEELKEMEKTIKETGDIALTDPDSKMMKVKNYGRDICHNVQIAVDAKNRLVVAVDVTSEACDKGELHNMALQAKNELGVAEITANVDAGYYASEQFKKCADDGINVIAPKPKAKNGSGTTYTKDTFVYIAEEKAYECPQKKKLYLREKQETSKGTDEYYTNPSACKDCLARKKCTKCAHRTIKECQHQRSAEEVDKRTKENADIVADRKTIIEHLFGTAKRNAGFSYFLTCGHENVLAESRLYFMTYNIKRAINLLGVSQILAAM